MTIDEHKAFIDQKLRELGEHYDAVQIMVAWQTDNGDTKSMKRGLGLWHARTGLAHEFLSMDKAQEIAI